MTLCTHSPVIFAGINSYIDCQIAPKKSLPKFISDYRLYQSRLTKLDTCAQLHPTGTSNDSDICDNNKEFWLKFQHGHLWEYFFLLFSSVQRNDQYSAGKDISYFFYLNREIQLMESFFPILNYFTEEKILKIHNFWHWVFTRFL